MSAVRQFITPPLTLFFVFTFFTLCSQAVNATPAIEKTPEWVKEKQPKQAFDYPEHAIEGGIYYLLVDTQVKVDEEAPPHYFYHYADHIVNQTGVENNSQINISFDPLYETALIHKIEIIRDGKRIDKSKTSRKKVIQREEDLGQLIYSGIHTLNVILDDVRVGDTINYSYSIIGSNPVYGDHFSYQHALGWSVPVEDLSIRLLWNKSSELSPTVHNSDATISTNKYDGKTEYTIDISKSLGIKRESDTPKWYRPWGRVYFSELNQWSEVVDWGLTLYENKYQSSPEIKSIAKQIAESTQDPEEQIYQALAFTQNQIRYMGIELGVNSHIPSTAAETVARRYGDCKDKTVLLITILKQLGIDADPVLVNTKLKAEILNRPVSPRIFNHVITKVYLGEKAFYLDPTRTHQEGNLSSIYMPSYGAVLVLNQGNDSLTPLPHASDNSSITIEETFTVPQSPQEPMYSKTKTIYKGWNAESERRDFEDSGAQATQTAFLEFFERYYPGSEPSEELSAVDGKEGNTFSITESYKISDAWPAHETKQGRFDTTFYANILKSYIDFQDSSKRKDPLYVVHPIDVSQTIKIIFPDDNWKFDNENFKKHTEQFEFSYSSVFEQSKRSLTLFFRYKTLTNIVTPEAYPDYVKALDSIYEHLSFGVFWYPEKEQNLVSQEEESNLSGADFFIGSTLVFVAIIALWRFDKKRNPDPDSGHFFPVSLPKFLAMWVLTFGIYGSYWFYRNFKYLKQQNNDSSMPMIRGIFSQFWYFSLWKKLDQDSRERHGTSHLPGKSLAVLLAVIYFTTIFTSAAEFLTIPALFLSAFITLPLANYINFSNADDPLLKHNSRWALHHYLTAVLCAPLLVLTFSSEVGLTPSSHVVKGDRILGSDIAKLTRKGVIGADEKIVYFYSDGLLSIQEDGNGFTDKSVFSYWKGENGRFNIQKADFDQIKDIQVYWEKALLENSTVTIIRHDDSEFVLYVSNENRKDVTFVDSLKEHWKSKAAP